MVLKLAKIATILVPIAIHASGTSVVELFADQRQMPESVLPDVASLMFVTATSLIAAEWLEKHPIHLMGTDGMNSFVVAMTGILFNIVLCDLSLRLLWIPAQYFLRYLKDQKVMALAIRWMFYFLRYFRYTRAILSLWIKASKTDAGFLFARNLTAAGYLLGTLCALNYLSVVKQLRAIRKFHPCGVPSTEMSSKIALLLAVLLHVGFKIVVFMEPPINENGCCSLRLNTRSVLFLSSAVMYLSRTKIFPQRYRKVPLTAQAVVEFFFFLLSIEIAMIAGWCRIEALLFKIFDCISASHQTMLYVDMGGENLVQFVVTVFSFLTFLFTAIATGYIDSASVMYRKAIDKLEEIVERVRRRREEEICHVCCYPPTEQDTDESFRRTPRRSPRQTRRRDSSGYDTYLDTQPRASSSRRSPYRRR